MRVGHFQVLAWLLLQLFFRLLPPPLSLIFQPLFWLLFILFS